jgi:hypothetical protein
MTRLDNAAYGRRGRGIGLRIGSEDGCEDIRGNGLNLGGKRGYEILVALNHAPGVSGEQLLTEGFVVLEAIASDAQFIFYLLHVAV